jgi:WhiB family redox-sensing transcriptional regulator
LTAVPNTPGRWSDRAACKGETQTFYANNNNKTAINKAVATCRACPVIIECKQYAMANSEEFGVWGGMTPEQRTRNTPPARKRALTVSCGTPSGYVKGCRCDDCRVAHATAVRNYRDKKQNPR